MQTPVSGYDARPLGALISRLVGAFVGAALLAACTDPQVKKKQYFESGNGSFVKKMYGHAIVK